MAKKILYYSIRGDYPFVCIMKQTEKGWYWWDIWEHYTFPIYYGKTKPRLHVSESYIISNDFQSVLPQIEQLMAEWKMKVLEDHKLEKTAHNYLEELFYRNKARMIQYYIDGDGDVITLETKFSSSICNGGEWTQVFGIIGDGNCRRSWYRQSDGDKVAHASIPQVTQEEARARASEILDAEIANYIDSIKKFCEVDEIAEQKRRIPDTGCWGEYVEALYNATEEKE